MYAKYTDRTQNQDNISIWIFMVFEKSIHQQDAKQYELDFSDITLSNSLCFVDLFSQKSAGYRWACQFSSNFEKILKIIQGINIQENKKTTCRTLFCF